MRRLLLGVSLSALLIATVLAQSAAPAFEAADVHASARANTTSGMRGGILRGTRYELRNASMVDLIRTAYDVDAERVLGGPSWLELTRYDIAALAPAGTPPPVLREMLKSLLAERFKLTAREDTQPMPAYVLRVGSAKPKLKESATPGGTCQGRGQQEDGVPMTYVTCTGVTLDAFGGTLRNNVGSYVTRPVVNLTGLTGSWDFEFKFTPLPALALAGDRAISLFDALDKQLGLTLTAENAPSKAIVVDRVNEVPTPNAPDIATKVPPSPTPEFEVGTIKPSAPDSPGPQARIIPTGQVTGTGAPLTLMISLAWSLPSPEMIVGPEWLATKKFDFVARAFSGQGGNIGADEDMLRQMLQALIVDRFQVKWHMEPRSINAYTLTAGKPKMTKADPSTRTRCTEGPAPNGTDPRNRTPINSRLITCQNVTMAQFAERLQPLAAGYLRTPVADETKLEGGWNLTLNFAPIGAFQQATANPGAAAGAPGAAAAAADPTGAISVFEAIDKQLGLKLEQVKRPVPVLVIDSIQEEPANN